MATEDPTRGCAETTVSKDLRTERVVLEFLLDEHPTRVPVDEIALALNAKDFGEKDGIARAVRDLTGVGLLRVDGELVSPTRAALRFYVLEAD